MNDNMAVRPTEETNLADVVMSTAEILNDIENIVCDIARKLYGYDMAPAPIESGNCMEQALVAERNMVEDICKKLDIICRRL